MECVGDCKQPFDMMTPYSQGTFFSLPPGVYLTADVPASTEEEGDTAAGDDGDVKASAPVGFLFAADEDKSHFANTKKLPQRCRRA